MVFNESTNCDFMYLARAHPADIFSWTKNWTCFWIYREKLPCCSPPEYGISCRTCQHHL